MKSRDIGMDGSFAFERDDVGLTRGDVVGFFEGRD
jgi:hypothetical protein